MKLKALFSELSTGKARSSERWRRLYSRHAGISFWDPYMHRNGYLMMEHHERINATYHYRTVYHRAPRRLLAGFFSCCSPEDREAKKKELPQFVKGKMSETVPGIIQALLANTTVTDLPAAEYVTKEETYINDALSYPMTGELRLQSEGVITPSQQFDNVAVFKLLTEESAR